MMTVINTTRHSDTKYYFYFNHAVLMDYHFWDEYLMRRSAGHSHASVAGP